MIIYWIYAIDLMKKSSKILLVMQVYDKSLKMDLQEFKISIDNIYALGEAYNNIRKIVKNRTKEKIIFLEYLFDSNIIDKDLQQELQERVQNDYKLAQLYLMGLVIQL